MILQSSFQKAEDFFLNGGLFMYPLALCSLLAGAAVIYKFLTLRRRLILPSALEKNLLLYFAGKVSAEDMHTLAQKSDSVLGRLLLLCLKYKSFSAEETKELIQAQAKEEFVRLQNGIPLLDMIINISPMFGILGTASGLVVVFSSFGQEGAQDGVALGIARALNTTIAGLAIAAPSVVAHMYFSRQLERYSAQLEILLTQFIHENHKPQPEPSAAMSSDVSV